MKVCIFVANNCTVDSRVLRQAETFSKAGHETIVVAVHRGDVPVRERRDGFEIRRVVGDPTWVEGYPRIARLLGLRDAARARGPAAPRPGSPRPAVPAPPRPPAGKRLTPEQWVVWVRSGTGPPPRGWPGGRSSVVGRAAYAVSSAARAPANAGRKAARVVRIQSRRARRVFRRRVLLPTRFRQIERWMAREAIAFGADLYWANDVTTLRPAYAARRKTGGRLVYDAHEVIWDAPTVSAFRRRSWGLVERTHVRRADRVFTVCEPIAEEMERRYRIPRPTVVLNCPRLSVMSRAPSPDASPLNAHRVSGERIVLFHGSLSRWRGLEQLIAAIELLPAGYRLVVLGHGPFRSTLEDIARRERLEDRITFLTSVPPQELPGWLVGADVGTIPYQRVGRNHEYSTPNKLFEYMHLGIPIVVNDLPEIRRIVTEVGFGVVCDCSDPAAIAKTIAELVSDPQAMERMRANARAAAPRYSWEAQEETILSVLR